jgi:hypothetical protein
MLAGRVEVTPTFAPAVPLAMAVVLGIFGFRHLTTIRVDETFPVAAVAKLKAGGASGNMVVPFDWGEYVIWHLGPRVKVSIDGRRETVYPDAVREADLRFRFGWKGWDKALEPADWALVMRQSPADRLMRSKTGWTLVYEDAVAAVFAREGKGLRLP